METNVDRVFAVSSLACAVVAAFVLPYRFTIMGGVAYMMRAQTRWGWPGGLICGAVVAAVCSELAEATESERKELYNNMAGLCGVLLMLLTSYALLRITAVPFVSHYFRVGSQHDRWAA